ncbi:MAG: aminotransferase class III-fold pyridoxal phosphate-dependent enzyme [Candidatus Limnocylindrales bacterium]
MSGPTDFDPVLASARPTFDEQAVLGIATATFGLRATAARNLGSERDQTFLLFDDGATPTAVMKLSNAADDPATLDMEALAVLHAKRVDPTLPLALPWRVPGADGDVADPATRRVALDHGGGRHHIRMYDVLPGHQRSDPLALSDAALGAWGVTTARVGRALRSFFHPAAQRTMLWDVQHASRTRAMMGTIRDVEQRALVERVLDRFDEVVAPAWPALRAQVIHSDLTTDNALVDDAGRITGIVDFGDMCYSALIVDLASLLDSLLGDRGADLFRAARLVLDGYQRITPLEPLELRLLGELLAARAAVTIAISSWRSERGLEDAAFAERYNDPVARTIATLLDTGWDEVARRFGADLGEAPARRSSLGARRTATMGPALEALSYETPLHLVDADGVWLTDVAGRRYLDAYNNVPCVGHNHPRVTEAIARQARRLNTNLRYVHEGAIRLAERIIATCPPELDTVFFVNSGSEANDLAWRLATTVTGRRGGLCTDFAYHGISDAIAPLSPESWPGGRRPEHVETWLVADPRRGQPPDPSGLQAAIGRLGARGLAPAAVILDGVLTSDGYPTLDPAQARAWLEATHGAGALWIADEVQGGYGRNGETMWSFQRLGLVPDIVTLGKPMGNGHPVGAVVTRRDIAQAFADETVFFSTFGGNPVSMAASLAVLDVLDDERVVERTARAGAALRDAIRSVAAGHEAFVDVRGVGLAIGVEVTDRATAVAIKEGLHQHGVLVGTSGRAGNVLKVRPPLAFTTAEVPIFADALAATLGAAGVG